MSTCMHVCVRVCEREREELWINMISMVLDSVGDVCETEQMIAQSVTDRQGYNLDGMSVVN